MLNLKTMLCFAALLYLYSCKSLPKNAENQNAIDTNNYTRVTVVDYSELAGCGFILSVNDTVKLIPESIPDSLKMNNLSVFITYKVTNKPNVCMAGKTIVITDVKPAR